MSFAARSFSHLALGDDLGVVDKWEAKDSIRGARSLSGGAGGRSLSVESDVDDDIKGGASSKVWPIGDLLRTASGFAIEEVLHEKGATRTLLWYYCQTLLYSGFVACFW